jgi:hypothetical protein
MRAIVIHEPGGPEVLSYEEVTGLAMVGDVTLVLQQEGSERNFLTDEDGAFDFIDLQPGAATLHVTATDDVVGARGHRVQVRCNQRTKGVRTAW